MTIIAELSLSSGSLPFVDTVGNGLVSQIEFRPILPTNRSALPLIRVWADDVEAAIEALRDDSATDSITRLHASNGTGLFRIEWCAPAVERLCDGADEADLILFEAAVNPDEWRVRVGIDEEGDLSAFRRHCADEGIDIDLRAVTTSDDTDEGADVTAAQREALLLAVDRGYFDHPRQVTLAELGDELDISRQAFAGRLRRGIANLVTRMLRGPSVGTT